MLVLNRDKGQRLIIGEHEIEIKVVHVYEDGAVKLGIEAPKHMEISKE